MNHFHHGDRIRYETTGEDGFPLVRYGFIGAPTDGDGPVVVMLDGELGGDVVEPHTLAPVHISTVTLILAGSDLLDDPSLRQGLVSLWQAEAESAGLDIDAVDCIGTGVRDASDGYALAELSSGDGRYVLRATRCRQEHDAAVMVFADRPNRWEVL